MDDISKKIKKLRTEYGYSLKDLSSLCGISASTLQRYENHGYANITTAKLLSIANALNVSPTYLIGYESRTLPSDEYDVIQPLLKKYEYKIEYHGHTEEFTLNSKDGSKICKLYESQIRQLVDHTSAFFHFEINNIINEINKEN